MGWRVSVYSLDKNKNFIEFDEDHIAGVNKTAKGRFYDYCTDLWFDLKSDEEFQKHIKCVQEDDDRDFYSIDKEGWIMFMNGIKDKHINYLKNLVEVKNPDPLNHETTYKEYIYDELYYWQLSFKDTNEKEDYGMYYDYRLDSNKLCGGITWMSAFYDALFLYKTLDWNKENLYIVGR